MDIYQSLNHVIFDPSNYDDDIWFVEQDNLNYCSYSDEPIQDPVIIITEYTLAHYKYNATTCCLRNLGKFYECLGTQPLKIVFRNRINDDIVKHFGLHKMPEINLNRKYYIQNNEVYLDTNEVFLNNDEEDNGLTYNDTESGSDTENESDKGSTDNESVEELEEVNL